MKGYNAGLPALLDFIKRLECSEVSTSYIMFSGPSHYDVTHGEVNVHNTAFSTIMVHIRMFWWEHAAMVKRIFILTTLSHIVNSNRNLWHQNRNNIIPYRHVHRLHHIIKLLTQQNNACSRSPWNLGYKEKNLYNLGMKIVNFLRHVVSCLPLKMDDIPRTYCSCLISAITLLMKQKTDWRTDYKVAA